MHSAVPLIRLQLTYSVYVYFYMYANLHGNTPAKAHQTVLAQHAGVIANAKI